MQYVPSLQSRSCSIRGAPLVLQGGHVSFLSLASLLSRDAIAKETLESFTFLLIFYVVVLGLRDFVWLWLRVIGVVVVVVRIAFVVGILLLLLLRHNFILLSLRPGFASLFRRGTRPSLSLLLLRRLGSLAGAGSL